MGASSSEGFSLPKREMLFDRGSPRVSQEMATGNQEPGNRTTAYTFKKSLRQTVEVTMDVSLL